MKKSILIITILLTVTLSPNLFAEHNNTRDGIEQTEPKSITLNNKSYNTINVEIYTYNKSTYEWEYLQTSRIPGGNSVSYEIGKYEQYWDYGYKVVDSYSASIIKFSQYPVNLY